MLNGLLPIGTVVLLHESKKKVMIIGVCQRGGNNPDKLWDYTGVVFPEGFLAADKMVLFNNEQISQVFMIGYQDAEQLAFKAKVDELIGKLREGNTGET
jgi:hypothetical protein